MRKQILVVLSLFLITIITKAVERPATTPNQFLEMYPKDWYVEKVKQWENYLIKNPEDKTGWLEYFKVAQYADFAPKELREIANKIQSNFAGTYEAHLTQFNLKGWTSEGVKALEMALRKQSNSEKVLPEQILLAEISFNQTKRKVLSQKLFKNKSMHVSLLNYSYNVLASVSDNGILIVQGNSASIPILMAQDLMNIKPNVKVLNIDLAKNQAYFSKWLSKNNLQGKDLIGKLKTEDLIQQLPKLNPKQDFFYALTLSQNQVKNIEQNLYVVGLVSRYAQNSFAQYEVLKENIEQSFLLDYLIADFKNEPKTATGRVYESNYILPLWLLKEYYENVGNTTEAKKWEKMILRIATPAEIKDKITPLLRKKEKTVENFKIVEIDIKTLDKTLKQVKGNLYASSVELSNREYWFYLDYLYKNNYKELYDKCKVDISKYDELTRAFLKNYHYSPENMKIAESFKPQKYARYLITNSHQTVFSYRHPALDMTHEAAKAYCEWLTIQYNQQEDRKFKKVRFRLPTQKEWTMTALGYKDFTSWNLEENTIRQYESNKNKDKDNFKEYSLADYKVSYPWGITFTSIKRANGDYLANVKAPAKISSELFPVKGDGFDFTAICGFFYVNDMGIADVIGNVAEMIDEEGKAMGGSWNHPPKECTITSVSHYEGSDTTVGFRLFMEVIEE